MFTRFSLLLVLSSILQIQNVLGMPTKTVPKKADTALHTCTVFVQRWYDNSLDVYVYGYAWTPTSQGPANIISVESVALSPGQSISATTGSQQLVTTDVANPAVVNGATNWNDPGKLSFTWGSQAWDSTASQCSVIPVGRAGNLHGLPTNTTCTFSCDGS